MSTKKILAILSEYGYWGIELVGPLRKLEAAGYKFDFMTQFGKKAVYLIALSLLVRCGVNLVPEKR